MVTVLVLIGYVTAVGVLFPRWLKGAEWTSRAPRLAMGTWLAAAASTYAVAVLAGAVLLVPLHPIGDAFVLLAQGCGWPPPRPRRPSEPAEVVGVALLTYLFARASWAVLVLGRAARREREHHRARLRLLGRRHTGGDLVVVDHPLPSAFCVPGDGGRVVLTTGALELLSPLELAAVVAHERAHLHCRHHAVVTVASVLAAAFPQLPLFTQARTEARRLVELAADDRALRRTAPATLARAILELAAPPMQATALGAASTATGERVLRLIRPECGLGRMAALPRLLTVAVFVTVPLAAVTVPSLTDLGYHCNDTVATPPPG